MTNGDCRLKNSVLVQRLYRPGDIILLEGEKCSKREELFFHSESHPVNEFLPGFFPRPFNREVRQIV